MRVAISLDPVKTVPVYPVIIHVGVSRGYTDHHQGRAIHMADSRID